MSNKKIEWIGEQKILPTYGVAKKGRVIVMFCGDADSYIKQGFAKQYAKPVKSKEDK